MTDLTQQAKPRQRGVPTIEFVPDTTWHADAGQLHVSATVMHASASCEARGALCAVCLDPLDDKPFSLAILVTPRPCENGRGHFPSSAVAIHATCEIPGDSDLASLIISLNASCAVT